MTTAGLLGANAFFVLIGAGMLVVTGVARTTGALAQRLALAPFVGMATAGIVGAISEPLHVGLTPLVLFLLALASLVAGGCLVEHAPGPPRMEWSRVDRLVGAGASLGLTAIGIVAALTFRVKPLVEYDSWAMWALKGRALAAFGWAVPTVFDSEAYRPLHLEYPLLLPVLHAVGIRAAGAYEGRLVIVQCLFIGIAGLLAIWGMFRDRVRPAILLPCLLALALVPGMFGQLATAYADVPLALFVAVAIAAAARWLVEPDTPWLALATLFFVAAALTKNEGLLFATAAYAGLLITAEGRRIRVVASGLVFGAALLPWRLQVARQSARSGNDYNLSSPLGGGDASDRLHRGAEALYRLLGYALNTGRFGLLLPLVVVTAVVALLTGTHRLGVFLSTYLIVSFAGLTWIYTISPLGLDSYLRQSGDRVVTSVVLGAAAVAPLIIGEIVTRREGLRSHEDSSCR